MSIRFLISLIKVIGVLSCINVYKATLGSEINIEVKAKYGIIMIKLEEGIQCNGESQNY